MNSKLAAALSSALAVIGLAAAPARSQELIAWPLDAANPGWRSLLPGMPPPRPLPRPNPLPLPRPIPMPPRPFPDPRSGAPLVLSGYKVDGKIEGPAANLSFDIVFHNPTPQRLEGVLVVPLPADTVLSGFAMTSAGKTMKAELLESGQAAAVYQSIVSQLRDPGLLELVGERMLRARVFPIEPNGDVAVHITWTQIARQSGGLFSLSVPVKSARFLQGGSGRASVRLELSAERPLRNVYSPLPEVKVTREGDRKAVIAYEPSASEPADLSLFYSMASDPLGIGLLAHREEGEDGFFLLSVSPKIEPEAAAVPKDILFVLDRSGSMEEDGKLDQAKKAVAYCLRRLGPKDRFAVVDFATDASAFEERLAQATPENKERALRYIARLEAAGGTNIDMALREGTRLLRPAEGRVPMVFFLTDGLPTVGETDMSGLLKRFSEQNSALRARVFTFGVGSDVNTLFLDKLAEGNRGAHNYILPGETIENKVSSLYQKVGHPALTDVRVEWKGVDADQVYPRPVPDLFFGSELALMGRYRSGGKGLLVVSGSAGSKRLRFEFPLELPAGETRHDFLPRLWANLKVSHELDAARLSGNPDPEVVRDIVRLAKRYGIVTPYTSFLITEEGRDLRNAHGLALRQISAMNLDAAESGAAGGAGLALRAQEASNFLMKAKATAAAYQGNSGAAYGAAPAMAGGMAAAEKKTREEALARGEMAVDIKRVGSKTFYRRGEAWVDGEVEALESEGSVKSVSIEHLSREYFDLLSRMPALSRCLSLGPNVTVLYGGTVYRIAEKRG